MKLVAKKLLQAIESVGGKVEKTGWNSYSKYKYITESDVNNAILPALVKQGLLHTASIEQVVEEASNEHQKNRFATVYITHTITDTDSGEQIILKSAGVAADTLDKSIYKAYTGACKYFWLKTFLISGDDADVENDAVTKPAAHQSSPKAFQQTPQQQAQPVSKPPVVGGFKMSPPKPTAPQQQQKPAQQPPTQTNSKWGFDKAGKAASKKETEVLYSDNETDTEGDEDSEGVSDDPGFV